MKTSSVSLPRFFSVITRAVMTLLTFTAFYIFCFTANMMIDSSSALEAYHAVPIMIEHILGGVFAYLIFALIFAKVFPSFVYD
ncbi:MAG: hypothetical protein E7672_05105 [Ruminococcaceae bacterium]|nr:hypothetical protein [Oscillospiraceae bacterium]